MRILYLDESGIGNINKEPHLVIAGAIINADRQWMPVKDYLQSLLEGATPTGAKKPKCFHAVDLYQGTGEFQREVWPRELRYKILDHIAKIPDKFRIPIVSGVEDRREHARRFPEDDARSQLRDCYAVATMQCFLQLEWYMRNGTLRSEVASVTIEENSDLQKRIKEVWRVATTDKILDGIDIRDKLLPLTRVIDEPSYQEKTASSILQLADFCAYTLKRAMGQQMDYQRFANPLGSAVLRWNRDAPPGQPLVKGPSWGWS